MKKRAKSGSKKPAAVKAPAVKHAAKVAKGKAAPKKAAASKAKKPAAPVKKAPPPAKAKVTLAKDSGKKAPLKSAPAAPTTAKKDDKKAAPAVAPSKAPAKGAPVEAKKAAPPTTTAKATSAAPGKKDMQDKTPVGKSVGKAGASAIIAKGAAAAPIKVEPKIIEAPQQEVRRPIGPLFATDELDHFRQLLLAERGKILAKARQTMEEGAIVVDRNEMLDEVDQAAQMVDQNLTFRLLDRDRKLLSEIDHALLKVENGDYGYCEGTGEPIPKRRLELRPWCRHSVKYKEKLERMEKSGRGVVDEDEIV